MSSRASRETIDAMRTNRMNVQPLVAALLMSTTACSWVFMQKPESHYSASTQPQCSESNGWPVVDAVFAALNVIGAMSIAGDGAYTEDQKTGYLIGGVAWGLIHVASGVSGLSWASKCTDAKERYNDGGDSGGLTPSEETKRRALEAKLAREEARNVDRRAREQAVEPAPLSPRGFFCSISAINVDAGFCVRDKAECQRTRDAAIVGVVDLAECALTERAFCFGDRCAPTAEACEATRARVIGPDGSGPECADSE